MTSVAQLDGTIVQPMIDTSLDSFDTRIKNFLTQHLQQHYPGPISAPTPFGATVSSGLPGTLQSQPNPILTVSGRALSNTKGTPNDYDKAMEVEQCKLCESAWKLVFDGCATNAYRQQKTENSNTRSTKLLDNDSFVFTQIGRYHSPYPKGNSPDNEVSGAYVPRRFRRIYFYFIEKNRVSEH